MSDDEYSLVSIYQRLANPRKGGVLYLILLDEFYVMSRSRDSKRSYWTLETFYSTLNTLNGRKNNSSSFLNGSPNMSSAIHQMELSFIFVQIIEWSWKKFVHNIAFPTSVSLHFTKHYPGGRLQGLTLSGRSITRESGGHNALHLYLLGNLVIPRNTSTVFH